MRTRADHIAYPPARAPRRRSPILATAPPTRTHRGVTFLVVALAATCLALPSRAADLPPDPTPPTRFFARERLVLDAWETRQLDGGLVHRRTVRNQLDLAWVDEGVLGVFAASFAFDEGLPSRPDQPLVRERQLQPELQRAYVRWRVASEVDLTAGRHDRIGALGFARLDGLSVRARASSWTLSAGAGLRPDDGILRIDGWAYLPDTDRETRADFDDHTVLAEAELAWDEPDGGLALGVRHEATVDRRFVDGTRLALGARIGARDGLSVDGRIRVLAQLAAVERADVVGAVPLGERLRLVVGERRSSPRLPPDSVFSVFPVTNYGEERAGLRLSAGRAVVEVSGVHRASRPVGSGTDDAVRTAGGSIDGRIADRGGRFAVDGGLLATGGRRGDTLRCVVGLAADPGAGPTWHLRQSVATQRLDRSVLGRRTGAFTTAGLSAEAGGWAELAVSTVAGWDDRNGLSARVMATADIDLQGGR